jgi:hypothetical protein
MLGNAPMLQKIAHGLIKWFLMRKKKSRCIFILINWACSTISWVACKFCSSCFHHFFIWAITLLTKHTIPIGLSICLSWGMEQDGKPLGISLEHRSLYNESTMEFKR